ncbi:Ral GTPase-activating protein subunit beta, partial [Fasciola gigantica]
RDTVHQICDFIAKQLKRDSKDHKRQLHSIIVAAYSCLSQWLVEHSHLIITDRQCLEVVLATIEFGICGAKSKPTRHEIAEALRNPNDSVSLNPPKPRALKSLNPSSKRVRDAAEACLAVLVSLAGQFPGASGPETTCSRLIEDHLLQLISPDGAILSTDLWQKLRGQFRYFWSEPGVIVGILETSQCRDVLLSHGFMSATHPHDLPQTLLVVRGPFGRHIWAVQMRLLPKAGSDSEQMTDLITTNGPPRPKPWGCFLERLIRTLNRNETIQPLNFPPSVNEIPLLDASDHTIGTLEQIGGAPGTKSREDINTLKSLIAAQSARMKEIGTRSLKTRLATPCPDPSAEATPPTVRTSFQAARLLLTHLGYLTVNSFSMLGPDATNMRLTQSGSITGTNGTGSVTDMRPSGQSNNASDNPAQTGSPPTAITTTATTAASNPIVSTGSGAPGTGVSMLTTDPLLQPGPLFYAIDSTHPEFVQQLESLDRLPTRTADTLLVFYVARGQTKTEEILGNMRSWSQLPTEFHAFLRRLGSYVDVSTHPGWTGRPETSYRPSLAPISPRSTSKPQSLNPIPDAAPDGTRQILYAADSITELACLCPTDLSLIIGADDERSCASSTGLPKSVPPRISGPISGRHGSVVGTSSGEPGADPTGGRVAVVWLQHWQDGPLNSGPDCPGSSIQNLTSQTFGCPVTIYISQLSSKLYRVGVIRAPGRVFDAGPLISGMVLSKRCLSSFVRQTVCNIARCRRLASDQFQPPHVRRQYRVFELGQTCRLRVDSLVTNNQKARVATHAIVKPETLLGLFTAAV